MSGSRNFNSKHWSASLSFIAENGRRGDWVVVLVEQIFVLPLPGKAPPYVTSPTMGKPSV